MGIYVGVAYNKNTSSDSDVNQLAAQERNVCTTKSLLSKSGDALTTTAALLYCANGGSEHTSVCK